MNEFRPLFRPPGGLSYSENSTFRQWAAFVFNSLCYDMNVTYVRTTFLFFFFRRQHLLCNEFDSIIQAREAIFKWFRCFGI